MTEADCPACAAALNRPHSGALRADCRECLARDLATGPLYARASRDKTITSEYKAALVHAFGAEGWLEGHKRVRAWSDRLDALKAAAA